MSQTQKVWLFLALVPCVFTATMPQQHGSTSQNPQPEPTEGETQPKNPVETGLNQYSYRAPVLTQNNGGYQRYPGYNRNTYYVESQQPSNEIFNLSSDGEFNLSAYFGQIFWGFVCVVVFIAVIIWLIRYFTGVEGLGTIVDKIKDTSATGRALDMDKLTNAVYKAFDAYGQWVAKEAQHSVPKLHKN